MSGDYSLFIGATGWIHPQWNESFYPDDLPEDWQLGYYANEFPVVLIGETEWRSTEDTLNWAEDSDANLRFVARIPAESHLVEWQEKLAPLKERLLALLLVVNSNQNEATLSAIINHWREAEIPLCFEFPAGAPAASLIPLLERQQTGWCWHGEGDARGMRIGEVGIAVVGSDTTDARQLRHYVETCLAASDAQRQLILLYTGTPPSIEAMRNSGVIRDFL